MPDDFRTSAEFETRFATETACRDYLIRLRWPDGFCCPHCGSRKSWHLRREQFECDACGRQTSATAGTIFERTRKPLRLRFRAMWCVTSESQGTSAMALQKLLALPSYQIAWTWLHKLRRAMAREDRDPLHGVVEVDAATLWSLADFGEEQRGLIIIAAEVEGRRIGQIRMRPVRSCLRRDLHAFVQQEVTGLPDAPQNPVESDLLARLVAQAEASFQAARAGSTPRAYAHDWKQFRTWCEQNRLVPLPASPQALIFYSTDLVKNRGKKLNTLSRRLAAVSQMHQQAGFESPTRTWAVKQFLQGLRREIGIAPVRKRPVLVQDLKRILAQLPDRTTGETFSERAVQRAAVGIFMENRDARSASAPVPKATSRTQSPHGQSAGSGEEATTKDPAIHGGIRRQVEAGV